MLRKVIFSMIFIYSNRNYSEKNIEIKFKQNYCKMNTLKNKLIYYNLTDLCVSKLSTNSLSV